jgi:hypothetical protein
MLRFAEDVLGLPTLTDRDKGANDMMGGIRFHTEPAIIVGAATTGLQSGTNLYQSLL